MALTVLPPYLELLNSEQRRAVLHTGKPLLILAGAGSGKTRVITTKIAWLIREQGVDPRSILAVTFTNKAAREMAERARLIDERAGDAMLRTFHSFGAWFLRRNGKAAGLDPGFVIYDDDDAVSLLSGIMEDSSKAEVKQVAHNISRAKDYFLSFDDAELALIDSRRKFRDIYALYEERLAHTGNVDFGDLIKKPVEILRKESEIARRFHDRFKVIMVDEYQDANVAQFEFLKELAGPETYICVVGDDDQSIYRFRGAEVKNILEFPDRFPGTEIIRLERNYRSTAPILRAASSVVDRNRGRLGKTLRAERGGGKLPVLAFLPDQDEETAFCAQLVGNAARTAERGKVWSDWAILYRTNAQSLGFETELLRRGIPYRVVGSLKFYEREEIKDALALLSFLVNPRDEVAFRRVVNKPARGVGSVTVDRIIEEGAEASDLAEAARALSPELSSRAKAGVESFLKVMEEGRALLEEDPFPNDAFDSGDGAGDEAAAPPAKVPAAVPAGKANRKRAKNREELVSGEGLSVCVVCLMRSSGIAAYHQTQDEVSGNQRLNNLQELANAASLYAPTRGGLLEFLEHIELDRSLEDQAETAEERSNAVTLITFHNTKGLEFRKVIMTGLEQGIFPREDKKNEELEEERRLFYVGATRAMDELYLTSCAVRRMFGRTLPVEPSLFLREIDKSSLRIIGETPYGFGAAGTGAAARRAHAPEQGKGVYGNTPRGNDAYNGGFDAHNDTGSWRRGDRLFHDDYGYGAVTEVRDSEDGPVVRVYFETGKELLFLGEQQGSRFTKIGKDD
ncbi:MAG: ATP-dependent helicase [Treponema sp.]|jgi:DNA helicase-2/ATP-dependent DNA helicase PcrA|nr:ATP-dependent helicase [Treponema sp.]